MSGRKHKNSENLCPLTRKRALGAGSVSATKSYEHTSSPSAITLDILDEMGIGMLDSEESSSSAMSAIALAVSSTSDENSNEMTPHISVQRMPHQQNQRMSLNSTADTTLDSSVNTTVVEAHTEDAQQRLLRQSAEKLHVLAQVKRAALSADTGNGSNSNSPNKRTRNPLATVTCNQQNDAAPPLPAPHPTPLNMMPSTSRQAMMRQQRKMSPPQASVPVTTRLETTESFFLYRIPSMSGHISSGINHFDKLSDEILLDIFKWLPKKTLLRMATVCRRFQCCARDETLWTRMDLGMRTLRRGGLEQVVDRGVVVLRLSQALILEPAFTSEDLSATRLQFLDLSLATISPTSLHILLQHCRQIKKLSLENLELNDEICYEIGQNKSLETLNLAMCVGLSANSVRILMDALTNLNSLNISWTSLTADAVTALVTHISPNVIRLNIAGCRQTLFDSHVVTMQKRCQQLLELDLSDCNSLTPEVIKVIIKFKMLEYLSLSRCYNIPITAYAELKKLKTLAYLDIFGTSENALQVLEKQLSLMGINKFIHSSVARPTVGTRRTAIWGLRTRD